MLSLCSPEGWLSCALAVVLVVILLVLLLAVVLLALVVFLLLLLLLLALRYLEVVGRGYSLIILYKAGFCSRLS